jgi:hypothetical protein
LYTLAASAHGYFAQQARLRLTSRRPAQITLVYRPPLGTYVWNIGPAGEFWDEGTVTNSAVTATEYDWMCNRDPHTGKEVGSWTTFAGALPYAIAPNTIAPEWVRRRFPASGPPPPPSDCKAP